MLAALGRLRADAARPDVNLMDATLACARAGVTTGEWSFALREVFGEYRAPSRRRRGSGRRGGAAGPDLAAVREAVRATAAEIGAGRLRLLLGKPGLDGHSNGVEQIAVRARDAGFEVIYSGIRLTPAQIAACRRSPRTCTAWGCRSCPAGTPSWCPTCCAGSARPARRTSRWWSAGSSRRPTPARCAPQGVAAVFTPADFGLTAIVGRIVDVIRLARGLRPWLTDAARSADGHGDDT